MKRNINLAIFSFLVVIVFTSTGTILEDETFEEKLSKGIETTGGSSILLEEYTATWCQICAEIDADVVELSELHSTRLILLRLHPADGVDNLGNYASATRINSLFGENSKGTPTFVIDGDIAVEGLTTISQINSLILQKESSKSNFTELYMSILRVDNSLKFEVELENNTAGVVNIMIFENKVTSNDHSGNLVKFDNVLREMISINLSDEMVISGGAEWEIKFNESNQKIRISATYQINGDLDLKNLGFITNHETLDEGGTSVKGSVQIVHEEIINEDNSYYLGIFLIFLMLGIFASFGAFKNNSNIIHENE